MACEAARSHEKQFENEEQRERGNLYMTASSHVLRLPEILEKVFAYLPANDLLVQQRVNKTWQAVIEASTPLQQTLFFKPRAHPEGDFDNGMIEWNPVLVKLSIATFENFPFKTGLYFKLASLKPPKRFWRSKALDGMNHPTASWRKMLVSNVASCHVIIRTVEDRPLDDFMDEHGVRLDVVVDALMCRPRLGSVVEIPFSHTRASCYACEGNARIKEQDTTELTEADRSSSAMFDREAWGSMH